MKTPPLLQRGFLPSRSIVFFGLISCLLLYLVRFGYTYGDSDQDEIVPAAIRVMSDGKLFGQDWFVSSQTAGFNVRSATFHLVSAVASVISLPGALFLLYGLCFGAIYFAIVAIARRNGGLAVAIVSALCILVLSKGFTLGGNDVVYSQFVPSMIAWALALWSIAVWLSRRSQLAGALAAAAVPFQALVGIHSMIVLVGSSIILSLLKRSTGPLRHAGAASAIFVLVAAYPVWRFAFSADPAETNDAFVSVLAIIRAPHHFLPAAFSASSYFRFGALAVAGTLALLTNRRMSDREDVGAMLAAIAAVCLVAWPLSAAATPWVLKLQLFKLTVFAKVLLVIAVASAAVELLRPIVKRDMLGLPGSAVLRIAALATALAIPFLAYLSLDRVRRDREARSEADISVIAEWARINTREDALFMVPPSASGFRSGSRRGIYVNYKATPFDEINLLEWKNRLERQIGGHRLTPGVTAAELDSIYLAVPIDQALTIGDSAGVNYVVAGSTDLADRIVFRAGSLCVYSLDSGIRQ